MQAFSPYLKIAAFIVLFFIGLAFLMIGVGGLGSIVLILPAISIGPVMGISFPFEPAFKFCYIFALALSVLLFLVGLLRASSMKGQFSAVIGVVLWVVCGFIGLGTGS